MARKSMSATEAVNALGAVWSDDVDRYAGGEIEASQIRCVLCQHTPCACPPFDSPQYLALVDKRHGKTHRKGRE
jgi:hypothetical protein